MHGPAWPEELCLHASTARTRPTGGITSWSCSMAYAFNALHLAVSRGWVMQSRCWISSKRLLASTIFSITLPWLCCNWKADLHTAHCDLSRRLALGSSYCSFPHPPAGYNGIPSLPAVGSALEDVLTDKAHCLLADPTQIHTLLILSAAFACIIQSLSSLTWSRFMTCLVLFSVLSSLSVQESRHLR